MFTPSNTIEVPSGLTVSRCTRYTVANSSFSLGVQYVSYHRLWFVHGRASVDFSSKDHAESFSQRLREYIDSCNQRHVVASLNKTAHSGTDWVRIAVLKYVRRTAVVEIPGNQHDKRYRAELDIECTTDNSMDPPHSMHNLKTAAEAIGKSTIKHLAVNLMEFADSEWNAMVSVDDTTTLLRSDTFTYMYTTTNRKQLTVSAVVTVAPVLSVDWFTAIYYAESVNELRSVLSTLEAARCDIIVDCVPLENILTVDASPAVQCACVTPKYKFDEILMKFTQLPSSSAPVSTSRVLNTLTSIDVARRTAATSAVLNMFNNSEQTHDVFFTALIKKVSCAILSKLSC